MSEQRSITLVVTNSQLLEAGLSATHVFTTRGGSIGASPSDDWSLRDREGSVRLSHCRVAFIDAHFCLTDTSDATYMNGASMPVGWGKQAKLNENDVLSIGPYQVHVHLDVSHGDSVGGPQTLDHLFNDGGEELDLDFHGEMPLFEAEANDTTRADPLTALDELESDLASDQSLSAVNEVEAQIYEEKVMYLLAKDQGWQGSSVTVQADSEHDESAAIYLKSRAKPSVQTAMTEPENEQQQYQNQASFTSALLSPERQKIRSTPNSAMTKKDNLMDDKVLDLLEEEVGKSFSLYDNKTEHHGEAHAESNHLVTGPMLRGLGVHAGDSNNLGEMQMLSEEMGASLQAAIKGLLALHSQVENSRYGVMNKNLQPIEDNPLRLGLSYEETVQTMFNGHRSLVHLSAPAAIEESLRTVKHHNEAVQAATSEALNQILRAFSPDVLMRRFNSYRRPGQQISDTQESWAWQMYQNYYTELTSNRQKGFEKLFWEIFDQAYDKQLREKQQEA
jgi:type VI secretion system protein ImpI